MVQYLNNNNNFNSGFAAFMAARNGDAPKKTRFGTFLWWTFLFLVAWWIVGLFIEPQTSKTNVAPIEPSITVDVSNVPVDTISSNEISATVQGIRLSKIDLKNFMRSSGDEKPVTLIDGDGFIEIGLTPNGTTAPTATTTWKKSGDNMVWRNNDGLEFTRNITVDGYLIRVSDTIKNNSKQDFSFAPFARVLRRPHRPQITAGQARCGPCHRPPLCGRKRRLQAYLQPSRLLPGAPQNHDGCHRGCGQDFHRCGQDL